MRLPTSSVCAFNPHRVCTTHRFQDKVLISDFKPSIYSAPWLHLTFLGKVWPCRARPCPPPSSPPMACCASAKRGHFSSAVALGRGRSKGRAHPPGRPRPTCTAAAASLAKSLAEAAPPLSANCSADRRVPSRLGGSPNCNVSLFPPFSSRVAKVANSANFPPKFMS